MNLNEFDAADVMQNVFQSVHRALPDFRREQVGSFRSWLWTITRNKINDQLRSDMNRTLAIGGDEHHLRLLAVPEASEEESGTEPTGSSEELLPRLAVLIREDFDPKSWTCFERMVIDGESAAEVALDLQISVAAVRQAKYRVLRHLRNIYAELN